MADTPLTSVPNMLTSLGFEPISPGISIYTSSKDTISLSGPSLIIVCSWAFAQPKHIAKYVQRYQSIYAGADILLVQNVISNALWKPDSWQMSFFQPAAAEVQAHLASHKEPRVFVHVFSNGGAHAAVQLAQACRETCGGMRLPVDALVLDSCPGTPRWGPTIAALTQGIPTKNPLIRVPAMAVAVLSVAGTALADALYISEPAAWKLYRKLNDPGDVFLLKSHRMYEGQDRLIPRTYIYSDSDVMILSEDVEAHTRVAKEKLLAEEYMEEDVLNNVKLEKFIGTAHVNHIKGQDERYWQTIQETWERRGH